MQFKMITCINTKIYLSKKKNLNVKARQKWVNKIVSINLLEETQLLLILVT